MVGNDVTNYAKVDSYGGYRSPKTKISTIQTANPIQLLQRTNKTRTSKYRLNNYPHYERERTQLTVLGKLWKYSSNSKSHKPIILSSPSSDLQSKQRGTIFTIPKLIRLFSFHIQLVFTMIGL